MNRIAGATSYPGSAISFPFLLCSLRLAIFKLAIRAVYLLRIESELVDEIES